MGSVFVCDVAWIKKMGALDVGILVVFTAWIGRGFRIVYTFMAFSSRVVADVATPASSAVGAFFQEDEIPLHWIFGFMVGFALHLHH